MLNKCHLVLSVRILGGFWVSPADILNTNGRGSKLCKLTCARKTGQKFIKHMTPFRQNIPPLYFVPYAEFSYLNPQALESEVSDEA
jgi:hypothetical protein